MIRGISSPFRDAVRRRFALSELAQVASGTPNCRREAPRTRPLISSAQAMLAFPLMALLLIQSSTPQPFHGYIYRMLTAQGKDAPGGAYKYLLHGRMFGGFAALAYPASYGVSGVKSFMVNHDGIVYEGDLGPKTAARAAKINLFDPGPGWTRSDVK